MIAATRRGYALPLVFLLSLVVALGLSLAVQRNSAQAFNVRRQVDGYKEHHAAKGLQEAISAWLNTQNARNITDALGENGHALDLLLPDHSLVQVFLRDGQGSILDPVAAGAGSYDDAVAIQQRLKLLCANARVPFEPLQRPLGPFEISVNSADPLVIQAAAEYLLGVDKAAEFVAKLLDVKNDKGVLARQDILTIAAEMSLENDVRNELVQTFTVTPELWYVTIELYSGGTPSPSHLLARYGGLAPLQAASSQNNSGAWEQPGVFLTWEDLGVNYENQGVHH